MAVNFNAPTTVNVNRVIYSSPETVRQMAIAMIVSMAEGNVDMVADMSEEYKTKDEIEQSFGALNEQALDMMGDLLDELKDKLQETLKNIKYSAKVSRLDYDSEGELADVTVNLNFE